jgi:hypothetical protein
LSTSADTERRPGFNDVRETTERKNRCDQGDRKHRGLLSLLSFESGPRNQ